MNAEHTWKCICSEKELQVPPLEDRICWSLFPVLFEEIRDLIWEKWSFPSLASLFECYFVLSQFKTM